MSAGPERVAFHFVRSAVGKAEMPGVGEVIRVISSDWRLEGEGVSWFCWFGCRCLEGFIVPLDHVAVGGSGGFGALGD